ncbi:hypothetical protein GGI15_000457 [Coemansia interrupta]|uniref:RRM domain-containing protein n=1 Tax=Coemansia interrupta TaxID=1126814 RepID=A0A9W8HKB4_9FUNG|nr:hypothetical protein GGI15_000457 [Coemansia interrupta]
MLVRLSTRAPPCLKQQGARGLACLSVNVDYGTLRTSKEDLWRTFQQVGKVWDVQIIESKLSGRVFKRAVVRFYDGEYQPGDMADSTPVLPPPTQDETRNVQKTVAEAVSRIDRTMLNGASLRVYAPRDNRPTQLHEWYEDVQALRSSKSRSQHTALFPINPFLKPPRNDDDDYRQGFLTGFKLGLKDGYKKLT